MRGAASPKGRSPPGTAGAGGGLTDLPGVAAGGGAATLWGGATLSALATGTVGGAVGVVLALRRRVLAATGLRVANLAPRTSRRRAASDTVRDLTDGGGGRAIGITLAGGRRRAAAAGVGIADLSSIASGDETSIDTRPGLTDPVWRTAVEVARAAAPAVLASSVWTTASASVLAASTVWLERGALTGEHVAVGVARTVGVAGAGTTALDADALAAGAARGAVLPCHAAAQELAAPVHTGLPGSAVAVVATAGRWLWGAAGPESQQDHRDQADGA